VLSRRLTRGRGRGECGKGGKGEKRDGAKRGKGQWKLKRPRVVRAGEV